MLSTRRSYSWFHRNRTCSKAVPCKTEGGHSWSCESFLEFVASRESLHSALLRPLRGCSACSCLFRCREIRFWEPTSFLPVWPSRSEIVVTGNARRSRRVSIHFLASWRVSFIAAYGAIILVQECMFADACTSSHLLDSKWFLFLEDTQPPGMGCTERFNIGLRRSQRLAERPIKSQKNTPAESWRLHRCRSH